MPRRGAARAEDAQGTPTQRHISPSILVYEDNIVRGVSNATHGVSNPALGASNAISSVCDTARGVSHPALNVSSPTHVVYNPALGVSSPASVVSNPARGQHALCPPPTTMCPTP